MVLSGRTVDAIDTEREFVELSLGGRGFPFTFGTTAGWGSGCAVGA